MMNLLALRRFGAALFVFLLIGAAPAAAQRGPAPVFDVGEIRGVIEGQIAAFKRDDSAAAFALASPGVQFKFGDPDSFMEMVRRAYLPVYRPKTVDFRKFIVFEGTPIQQVLVVGPDGHQFMALYFMERQPDGSWRISGCTLLEPPGVAV